MMKRIVTLGFAAAAALSGEAGTAGVVGFVPATVVSGVLVENATLNPDVTIRNNRFHDYPHLRLSGRGRYLVEGNTFQNVRGSRWSAVGVQPFVPQQ